MNVILLDDVEKVGRMGDIVKVADGYARNYLLPRKLAAAATPGRAKELAHQQRVLQAKLNRQKGDAEKVKSGLERLTLTIARLAGEEGKLFGSVTSMDIERALEERGHPIERRKIHLADPIKSVGSFVVPVRLHRDVEARIKVEVVPKPDQAGTDGTA